MDPLSELNTLAENAQASDSLEPLEIAIERWQHLFYYNYEQAKQLIVQQRLDLSTGLLAEDLWRLAENSGEASGHDRESYTHLLKISQRQPTNTATGMTLIPSDEEFLFKLEGKIPSAEILQKTACLASTPTVHTGTSDDEIEIPNFCIVDSSTKQRITKWLVEQGQSFPNFVPLSIAPKSFSSICMAPFLGRDTTLPQHRLQCSVEIPRPKQDEYPVWYFFYGTLQDPEKLRSLFEGSQEEVYELKPAKVFGGKMTMWGGKYKALVDAPMLLYGTEDGEKVEGKAFLVESKEYEDALRLYESKAYEVVRCMNVFDDGKEVAGCTFRFRG